MDRYLIPGWRMGWIVVHDRNEALSSEVLVSYMLLIRQMTVECIMDYLLSSGQERIAESKPKDYR